MIKKIDHIVITTDKPQACLVFYEKLGFSVRDGHGRFELFAGDFKINLHVKGRELLPHAGHVQTGSADLCFEIDEPIERFKARVEAVGILPESEIVERHGVYGAMSSLYFRDPEGNLLEFCDYTK